MDATRRSFLTAVTAPAAMPEYFAYQRTKVGNVVTIVSLNLPLTQDEIDPTADLCVYADVVTIAPGAKLSLPGREIRIRARKLVAGEGAAIDVSGAAPNRPADPRLPPDPAADGKPGTPGIKGDDAAGGKDAGKIAIVAGEISGKLALIANGGTGQRGQDGQKGGKGGRGPWGNDGQIIREGHFERIKQIVPAERGHPGMTGGQGGAAGKSGNGGKGGDVQVSTLASLVAGQLSLQARPGGPGEAANPGAGGDPGVPGIGGRKPEKRETRGPHGRIIETWYISENREASGGPGNPGARGDTATPAQAGAVGSLSVTPNADLAGALTPDGNLLAQYKLAMHQAELAYLASDFANTAAILTWVAVSVPAPGKAPAGIGPEWTGLQQTASVLLSQLARGLDYFGDPLNHVPMVKLDEYQRRLDALLGLGTNIESVYGDYTKLLEKKTTEFKRLDDARNAATQAIAEFQKTLNAIPAQEADLQAGIRQLTDDQEAHRQMMMLSELQFRQAVERKAQECTFEKLLNLVKSIVAVATGAQEIFSKIVSIPTDPKKFIDALTGKEGVINKVISVEGKAEDVAKAWQAVMGLNTPATPDFAKMAMDKDKFDKLIAPYLDMPEARKYKQQVNDFVAVVQARQTKVLEYTQLVLQAKTLEARIAEHQGYLAWLAQQKAEKMDPTLSPMRSFMQSLYEDFKRHYLKLVYREYQAYRYWSLREKAFSVSDNKIAGLIAFHAELSREILTQIDEATSTTQHFGRFEVVLRDSGEDARASQFETLRKTGKIAFSIPLGDPTYAGWSKIYATGWKISIPGATTSAKDSALYVRLWHQGRVTVKNERGQPFEFSHARVFSVYQYGQKKDEQTGKTVEFPIAGGVIGDDKRIGLSPFSAWTLELPRVIQGQDLNPGLALANVHEIRITLSGHAVAIEGLRQAAQAS